MDKSNIHCGMYTIVICVYCLPVSLHHWCLLYNCKKMGNSWESDSPLPWYKFICARKADSSSYNPNNCPEFSLINAPIFSKEASSNIQDGSSSVTLHLQQAFYITLNKRWKRLDFPLPVGMHIVSHTSTDSFQSVSSIVTTDGDSI